MLIKSQTFETTSKNKSKFLQVLMHQKHHKREILIASLSPQTGGHLAAFGEQERILREKYKYNQSFAVPKFWGH